MAMNMSLFAYYVYLSLLCDTSGIHIFSQCVVIYSLNNIHDFTLTLIPISNSICQYLLVLVTQCNCYKTNEIDLTSKRMIHS